MVILNIPGWVDLQINGFKGIDFSNPNLTLEDIEIINGELHKVGVITYCPTIISSSIEMYENNLPLIAHAIKSKKRSTNFRDSFRRSFYKSF